MRCRAAFKNTLLTVGGFFQNKNSFLVLVSMVLHCSCTPIKIFGGIPSGISERVSVSNLVVAPLTYVFPNEYVNASTPAEVFTFSNSSSFTATTCTAPVLASGTPFSISSDGCGTSDLAANGSCSVSVVANSALYGTYSTTLSRTCTIGGTAVTASNQVTFTAYQPATQLVFSVEPVSSAINQSISPSVVVIATDSNGIVDPFYSAAVSVALANGTGIYGTLSGTTTVSASSGVATFNNLSVSAPYTYYLQATSGLLSSVTSTAFQITGGTPTQLAFVSSVSGQPVNTCYGPFEIESQDVNGNVSNVSSSTTLSLSSGSGTGLFYAAAGCTGSSVGSVTIASGSNHAIFYFQDSVAESLALTATSSTGLTSATTGVQTVAASSGTWYASTTEGGCQGLTQHSAVWTGSEMIVWGGYSVFYALNVGAKYNPTTDSWVGAISTTGAPAARYGQTAVWTGSQMLIWGGYNNVTGAYFNDGGIYNPSTDTWGTPITTTGAPSVRKLAAGVWTGSQMIVWGGYNGSSYLANGGIYNPSTNAWGTAPTTTGALSARDEATAVWTGTEMIVWGGYDGTNHFNTGGRYNPTTNTWGSALSTTHAPSGRAFHTAIWTGTEMIVWGGTDGTNYLNTGGFYNPTTDTWSTSTPTLTNAPLARDGHSAVWSGTEMIIYGGVIPYGGSIITSSNTLGRYNPSADSWTTSLASVGPASGREAHAAVWTGSEMILWGGAGGGYGLRSFAPPSDIFNPTTNAWTTAATIGAPSGRNFPSAVWTGTEMIVWGGIDVNNVYQNTGGIYNPTTDTWGTPPTTTGAPTGREYQSAIWTGTEMLIWGGYNGSYLNSGAGYNPTTDSWGSAISTTGAPSARGGHGAVWTGTKMIIWGGTTGTTQNTGGIYNPSTDTWGTAPTTTGAPGATRYFGSGVWTGTEMIVWGGVNGSGVFQNAGGAYNPATDSWTTLSTTNAPSARAYFSTVWTGSAMIVWGGLNSTTGVFSRDGMYYAP